MNMHIIRSYLLVPTVALFLFGVSYQHVKADDIDIYLNPSTAPSDVPVVMLTLDYASQLGSTACGGGSCNFFVGKTYLDAGGAARPFLDFSLPSITRFDVYKAAFKYVLQKVADENNGKVNVKIGLAMPHDDGSGAGCTGPAAVKCTNGGTILFGATLLDTQTNRDALYARLDRIPSPQGAYSHQYQPKEMFFELFRYFGGQAWYNLKNGWADHNSDDTYNNDNPLDYQSKTSPPDPNIPFSWDPNVISGTKYNAPTASECAKLYTVNLLFQTVNADEESNTDMRASTAAGGMQGLNPSNKKVVDVTEVIRWMYDNDVMPNTPGKQNVVSYFIVDDTKVNTTTRGYAGAGVGVAAAEPFVFGSDPEALIEELSKIFRNILSVSASFVAPSVAVNVYNRAQTLNDVFIAMFQADPNGLPAWPGNLKKFRIGINSTSQLPEIQDANGANAVAVDGRIKYEALSYWTILNDLPAPSGTVTDVVAGKDGRIIDRGGAGSKIPGFKLKCTSAADTLCRPGDYTPGLANPGSTTTNVTTRRLYTASPIDGSLKELKADVGTATDLMSSFGVSSAGTCAATDSTSPPTACYLLKYVRGVMLDGTTTRPWLMGDLLHSRPIAVNYGGSTTNPDIRVLVGSNDGFFRMIRNTGSTINGGPVDGVESWAFMPLEVMPTIRDLAANAATTPPHPYTTDGAVSVYVFDQDGDGNIESGDKVYAFFGLRRGGKAYYALDITNPDSPTILWHITKGSPGSDFAELGQTWSAPKVVQMFHSGNTTAEPVVIFGGGYDPDKDTHPGHGSYTSTGIGSDDDEGNAIFVVDAKSGKLIWKAIKGSSGTYSPSAKALSHPDLKDSIPSDVAVIDTNGNSLADRLYVGDTGGVMWRVDMSSNDQSNWKISKLFSVGRHSVSTPSVADDKRFFYPPDYAQSLDDAGSFDAVTVGTGDRENPRDTTVTNYFYMYKDRYTDSQTSPSADSTFSTIVHSDFDNITGNCLQDATCGASTPSLKYGWTLKLECPPSYPGVCGEKSLATALTLGGSIFFTTYIPPDSTAAGCSLKEGKGLLYRVSLQNGTAVQNYLTGAKTGLTKDDRITELRSPGIPAEVTPLGEGFVLRPDLQIDRVLSTSGLKTFWYQKYH